MRISRKLTCSICALALLWLNVGTAAAQQVTVVRAARMLDVKTGRMVQNAVVVIEGGRIKSVGSGEIPEDADIIDLGNLTLLPGLIDMHVHLTGDLDKDSFNRRIREGAADAALRGARNARRTLLAGFTTVRDMASDGFSAVALMRASDRGLIEGPRIFPAAHGLGITGGHCDATGLAPGILEGGPERGVADGADEILKAVRYQIKHGASSSKPAPPPVCFPLKARWARSSTPKKSCASWWKRPRGTG